MRSILWVDVVQRGGPPVDALPQVLGRHEWSEGYIRFRPHFPFEAGVVYRATFDPGPLRHLELHDARTIEFSLPRKVGPRPTEVTQIYPSSDDLPENLLRFYVCFSNPMERGRAGDAISIVGSDGEPVADVLYRAPVELWDPGMRILTVLLDPGRLKRGVGPNRKLGPPLAAGGTYTLQIGAGMTDMNGDPLREPVHKQFKATEAVRRRVAAERWELTAPVSGGLQPLTLTFPSAMDWALLFHCVSVASNDGHPVLGRIMIDQFERRWRFIPRVPWKAGRYNVMIDSTLEDPCGNDLLAQFDRPIGAENYQHDEIAINAIPFEVQSRVLASPPDQR